MMYSPGLIKRLLLVVYDGLLLIAVAMVSSSVLMMIFLFIAPDGFFIDPATLENPKMIALSPLGRAMGGVLVCVNCLVVSFVFYGWFWTHGGQTLGMRAWNLYLIKPDGKFISWRIALTRYLAALASWAALGIGFVWILVDKRNFAWHDIWSDSKIIFVPKDKQPARQE